MTGWHNSILTGDVREHEGVQHDALDDARHQVRCVADCLRRQQAIADGGEQP